MNMWQISKTEGNHSETITGALTYNEALQKLNTLKRAETSEEVSYKVEVFMPLRAAREAKQAPAQQEERKISVRTLSAERKAQLLAAPQPAAEQPTKYAHLSDAEILSLDLDSSLSRSDNLAIQQEMSSRKLYGN